MPPSTVSPTTTALALVTTTAANLTDREHYDIALSSMYDTATTLDCVIDPGRREDIEIVALIVANAMAGGAHPRAADALIAEGMPRAEALATVTTLAVYEICRLPSEPPSLRDEELSGAPTTTATRAPVTTTTAAPTPVATTTAAPTPVATTTAQIDKVEAAVRAKYEELLALLEASLADALPAPAAAGAECRRGHPGERAGIPALGQGS